MINIDAHSVITRWAQPEVHVEFLDGEYFHLEFDGGRTLFLNCFEDLLRDFCEKIVEKYNEEFHLDPDRKYRECLAEWYADTILIEYPERFRSKEDKNDQD